MDEISNLAWTVQDNDSRVSDADRAAALSELCKYARLGVAAKEAFHNIDKYFANEFLILPENEKTWNRIARHMCNQMNKATEAAPDWFPAKR